MSLLSTIKADQLVARKAKQQVKIDLLTTLLGEATMVGKNAKPPRESSDVEVIATIKKFVKNTTDFFRLASDAGNATTCNRLNEELEILNAYLPVQLCAAELEQKIHAYIENHVDGTPITMGSIMQYLKTNFDGQYDGKLAATIIKCAPLA